MAYGPDLPEMYKRAVTYIDKILRGAKLGDLPMPGASVAWHASALGRAVCPRCRN